MKAIKLILLPIIAILALAFAGCEAMNEAMKVGETSLQPMNKANAIQVKTDPEYGNPTQQAANAVRKAGYPLQFVDTSNGIVTLGQVGISSLSTMNPYISVNGNVATLTGTLTAFSMYGQVPASVRCCGSEGSPMGDGWNVLLNIANNFSGRKIVIYTRK